MHQTTTLELGADEQFTTRDRSTLDVHLDRLHRPLSSDEPHTADAVVDTETWAEITDGGSFHTDSLDDPPAFDDDMSVDVRLVLDPGIASRLPNSGVEIADRLDDPEDELCRTWSWFLTEASQTDRLSADDVLDWGQTELSVTTRWKQFFAPEYHETTTESVERYLDEADVTYETLDETLFQFAITLDEHRRWPMFAHTDDYSETCLLYAVFPERVPAERRGEAAELVAAHNYDRSRGAFGVDFADGEVRFRLLLSPTYHSFDRAMEISVEAMRELYDDIDALAGPDTETDGVTDRDSSVDDVTDRDTPVDDITDRDAPVDDSTSSPFDDE
jgi:hypothetical protein